MRWDGTDEETRNEKRETTALEMIFAVGSLDGLSI